MNAVEISRKRGASLRPKDKKKKRSVNRLSLVFMKPSPNFCSANSALGIAGVSGIILKNMLILHIIIPCVSVRKPVG